ncbi:patB, partial [Symbiodinium necroappetens]
MLRDHGFSIADLLQAGVHLTLQQCVAAHYSLPELKEAGYSAREMKGVFPLHEFREAGFNYVEMKEAQLADTALAAAGFTLIFQEMPGLGEDESPRAPNKMSKFAGARDAGQVGELKEEGCSLEELKSLGFGPAALKAHYSVIQLKGAGFSVAELKAVCTLRELRMAGFSVAELKEEFSVADLKSAGFSAAQLKEK